MFGKPSQGKIHVTLRGIGAYGFISQEKKEKHNGTLDNETVRKLEELLEEDELTNYYKHTAPKEARCIEDGEGYTLDIGGRVGCFFYAEIDDAPTKEVLDALIDIYEEAKAESD